MLRRFGADVRNAFAFLSILPFRPEEGRKPGYAFAYFPLVGFVLGIVLAASAVLLAHQEPVRAWAILFIWVIFTGGLHLDGFADSCDGLLATTSPERRLEIMKDPRAGSWAVAGVCLLLLGKLSALGGLNQPLWLILPPVAGRLAMVFMVRAFPPARPTGLGAYFRNGLGRPQTVSASLLGAAICLALGLPGLLCLSIGLVMPFAFGRWAAGRLGGGLTGDTYGAICELTELLCLFSLSLLGL
jgi:adenosylcobinamide-GDP ribazoletransferase